MTLNLQTARHRRRLLPHGQHLDVDGLHARGVVQVWGGPGAYSPVVELMPTHQARRRALTPVILLGALL